MSISESENSCNCIIEDLLKKRFSARDYIDKKRIIDNDRPTPEIKNFSAICRDRNREYSRHFYISNYSKYKWLTGCPKLKRLFCWPCILFGSVNCVWTQEGYNNIVNLIQCARRHEKSKSHIKNCLSLCSFGNVRVDVQLEKQKSLNISKHNDAVKKNRDILIRLIDTVCFLSKQDLWFRGHDESVDFLNRGNYVELLNYLKEYDHLLEQHFKESTVFRGTSKSIQNDIIGAVCNVIISKIKCEVLRSEFVAILLDECTDLSNKSQLSTVVRYIDENGHTQERFLGFVDVSSDRSADALYRHVVSVVDEYNLKDKLIAQTYDGAAVMSGNANGLQAKVRQSYPQAYFVHCYSHNLNLVLQQSAAQMKDCSFFFKMLSTLSSFFPINKKDCTFTVIS